MGLVRFELTIDGSLRKRQVLGALDPDPGFKSGVYGVFEQHIQCSNGSSLLTASGSLG